METQGAAGDLTLRPSDMPALFDAADKAQAQSAWTNFRAKWGPIPLMKPEPRYFSMPSGLDGCVVRMLVALNC